MLSDNSEDDLFLISHGRDNSLIIWEIKVEPNFNLSKNFDLPDKNEEEIFLVAGYESGEIILFNLSLDESNFAVGKVKYFKEPVLCLDVSPDGHLLIAGGPEPKVVKLSLDFDKKKPPSTFFELELNNVKGISDLKFRKDQKLFGLAGWDKNIRIFKSENLQTLAMFTSHRDGINCLDFSNPIDKKTDIHPKSNSLVISKDRDADDIHFLESSVVKNYLIAASKDTKISLWQIY
ncbi:Guanine nucleotide binding protein (G protein), beta polypeptide 1-like [Clydaea vesicula]|uniref:ASTRA-associated protein 1 n=1 Tax=Clydaea vesicula TaxID=447962 RepID=A0AAD5TV25_9FUNG|nr:Guanine nucleotide binding protein (G protein), beta polypeptide 1-like [Clydaea vesicula]